MILLRVKVFLDQICIWRCVEEVDKTFVHLENSHEDILRCVLNNVNHNKESRKIYANDQKEEEQQK